MRLIFHNFHWIVIGVVCYTIAVVIDYYRKKNLIFILNALFIPVLLVANLAVTLNWVYHVQTPREFFAVLGVLIPEFIQKTLNHPFEFFLYLLLIGGSVFFVLRTFLRSVNRIKLMLTPEISKLDNLTKKLGHIAERSGEYSLPVNSLTTNARKRFLLGLSNRFKRLKKEDISFIETDIDDIIINLETIDTADSNTGEYHDKLQAVQQKIIDLNERNVHTKLQQVNQYLEARFQNESIAYLVVDPQPIEGIMIKDANKRLTLGKDFYEIADKLFKDSLKLMDKHCGPESGQTQEMGVYISRDVLYTSMTDQFMNILSRTRDSDYFYFYFFDSVHWVRPYKTGDTGKLLEEYEKEGDRDKYEELKSRVRVNISDIFSEELVRRYGQYCTLIEVNETLYLENKIKSYFYRDSAIETINEGWIYCPFCLKVKKFI
jgi:hypothetical protein